MFVEDVRALFDLIIDEPDVTYITVAQRRTALAAAEANYRQFILASEERAYAIEQDITVLGTQEYDLGGAISAVRLMGPSITTAARLYKLHRVGMVDDAGNVTTYLGGDRDLASTTFSQDFGDTLNNVPSYTMIGTVMRFSNPYTGVLRLVYTPASTTDWTKDAPLDNEFIDDFDPFHKIIALIAARDYYTTRDGATHQRLEAQVSIELDRMASYLGEGRFMEMTGVKETW
jgi:hypothetical protein